MNMPGVWRTVTANWRRLFLVYLAGWPGLALVLALTWVELQPGSGPGGSLGQPWAKPPFPPRAPSSAGRTRQPTPSPRATSPALPPAREQMRVASLC